MPESAKETYLRLRTEGADHEKAARYARIHSDRTKRAYRKLWDDIQKPAPTDRRAGDLTALATKYGQPNGLRHLEADYLAGKLELAEIQECLDNPLPGNGPFTANPLPPNPICPHCGQRDCREKHQYAQPAPPPERPPVKVDFDPFDCRVIETITPEQMRNPSDDLEQRSRRAAMEWNIIHGGSPLTSQDAAVMADQPATAPIAIPFMKPTIDLPYNISEEQLRDTRSRWEREGQSEKEAAAKKRIQQMRAEDAARKREQDVLMGRVGPGWITKRP